MRRFGRAAGRRLVAWACAAMAPFALVNPSIAAEPFGNARILYFEPFQTTIDPRPALREKRTNGARVLKFDAYGRRFELNLEPNAPLDGIRASQDAASVQLYRGELTGIAGSWARISTLGPDVHGLIWDGAQLYVIEPSDSVRDAVVAPLDPATNTVLFRLADTILEPGASMCATPTAADAPTGRESYDSLKRELNALKNGPAVMQAMGAALRLEVAALGDAQFRAQFPSDAAAIDQILLRLNNVDGIFAAELGVQIQVPTALVYGPTSDPLPATTDPSDLLRRLAAHRAASPDLKARGLTHLFTGRDLDGATVGIGYIDSVCHSEWGVALTEARNRGAWLESLVAAHEIGHNFGSVHDGESECSHIAQNQFLMSPTVFADKATFSSCSRDRMSARIATATCITTLPPADLALPAELGIVHEGLGRSFQWTLPIRNLGGRTSSNARVEVLLPASLDIIDAWIAGGTCTSGAGVIDCDIGSLAGGVTRSLNVTLRSRATGSSTISARLISWADARTDNNAGEGTIKIDPERDMGIALQAPAAVIAGDTFSATFAVNNAAHDQAQAVAVELRLPTNVSATAASIENGTCDLATLMCSVATLDAGAAVTGSLTLRAWAAGTGDIEVRVSAASFDPHQSNDTAVQPLTVSSPSTQSASSASTAANRTGGGGAFGLPLVLALLALGATRRRVP